MEAAQIAFAIRFFAFLSERDQQILALFCKFLMFAKSERLLWIKMHTWLLKCLLLRVEIAKWYDSEDCPCCGSRLSASTGKATRGRARGCTLSNIVNDGCRKQVSECKSQKLRYSPYWVKVCLGSSLSHRTTAQRTWRVRSFQVPVNGDCWVRHSKCTWHQHEICKMRSQGRWFNIQEHAPWHMIMCPVWFMSSWGQDSAIALKCPAIAKRSRYCRQLLSKVRICQSNESEHLRKKSKKKYMYIYIYYMYIYI